MSRNLHVGATIVIGVRSGYPDFYAPRNSGISSSVGSPYTYGSNTHAPVDTVPIWGVGSDYWGYQPGYAWIHVNSTIGLSFAYNPAFEDEVGNTVILVTPFGTITGTITSLVPAAVSVSGTLTGFTYSSSGPASHTWVGNGLIVAETDPATTGPAYTLGELTATLQAAPPVTAHLSLSASGPGAAYVTWTGGTDGQELVDGTEYSVEASLSSPLYVITGVTLDGAPSANPATFTGDGNDHAVAAATEPATRNIYTSLTLVNNGGCPAGTRPEMICRSGSLIVQGTEDQTMISGTAPGGASILTLNGAIITDATESTINIGAGGSWVGQRLASLTINGSPATFLGASAARGNLGGWYSPADIAPGTGDVTVAAVIMADALCQPEPYDPERRACPIGTVWNGTTCIPVDDGSHGCPPGTSWDPTVGACVTLPNVCPPGTYWNGTACVTMPGEPPRTQCPPGTYWNGTACVAYTTPCPPGTHWDGTACVPDTSPCPPGTVYNSMTGACDPIVPPSPDDTTGAIEVRARLNGEWVQARCDTGGASRVTPALFEDVAPGSYTVSASFESPATTQAFSSSRSVVVVAGQTSYVQFDWYEHRTDQTTLNEIQVYAHAGAEDVSALIRITRSTPDVDVSGQSPFALAVPSGADGLFTITGVYGGHTRTASVTTIAPAGATGSVYVVHLYFPANEFTVTTGVGSVTDPQPPTDYDPDETAGFTICWQDEGGIWKKRHELGTGTPGHTKPERTMHQLGAYRTRRYEFEHTARKPLVLVGIEEDVEVLK